jgi:hypothetical protein
LLATIDFDNSAAISTLVRPAYLPQGHFDLPPIFSLLFVILLFEGRRFLSCFGNRLAPMRFQKLSRVVVDFDLSHFHGVMLLCFKSWCRDDCEGRDPRTRDPHSAFAADGAGRFSQASALRLPETPGGGIDGYQFPFFARKRGPPTVLDWNPRNSLGPGTEGACFFPTLFVGTVARPDEPADHASRPIGKSTGRTPEGMPSC